MQDRVTLNSKEINKDLLKGVLNNPMWFWSIAGLLALVVLAAVVAYGVMVNRGMGVTGLNRPVMWALDLTNFVFWAGVSLAGVMISAILRMTYAEWRRPITRVAESLTLFALISSALMVGIVHVGRPWRAFYWLMPYDFSRGLFTNIRSPALWDMSAITTYLIGSSLFVFVALIPDLAVLRDRTKGPMKTVYSFLSLGFRGNPRQWKLQAVAGILLSALILPVFVSVHSVVSWDFATQVSVPAWHSTIFAPYFVLGAIHSGGAAVLTLMALMRWLWGWDKYIRKDHFDAVGKVLIVVATAWFFCFALEFLFAFYSQESPELEFRNMQLFEWPWALLFYGFLLTAYFIPVPLWLFSKVRRNIALMFFTSILVNIGMWLERFMIIVPGLSRKQPFTFDWSTYHPSVIEILIVVGTFALVALGLLLFSKVFPLIPLYDIKEGQVLADEVKIGRKKVPAVIKE